MRRFPELWARATVLARALAVLDVVAILASVAILAGTLAGLLTVALVTVTCVSVAFGLIWPRPANDAGWTEIGVWVTVGSALISLSFLVFPLSTASSLQWQSLPLSGLAVTATAGIGCWCVGVFRWRQLVARPHRCRKPYR